MALTAADPLPSWHEGPAKEAILAFVDRVCAEGAPEWVPEPERIAVVDNDGTLWPEQPLPFQAAFAFDELQRRIVTEPALAEEPLVRAALAGDLPALLAGEHFDGLLRIVALTHAGMSVAEFQEAVEAWLASARHPRFGRPYEALAYVPMLELLRHLRANGFKTYIVSGGGADFMREWVERVYGLPPQQVVGSTAHPRPSFGIIVHHTDDEREYAYDAVTKSTGKLVTALEQAPANGWLVVDMRRDWRVVFAAE